MDDPSESWFLVFREAKDESEFDLDFVKTYGRNNPKRRACIFPTSKTDPDLPNEYQVPQTIVVVGANGSGKTKLGSWIEQQMSVLIGNEVHRIAAQKSLSLPARVRPSTAEEARVQYLYGFQGDFERLAQREKGWLPRHKFGQRWHSEPDTYLLNDYEYLMELMFSERNFVLNNEHERQKVEGKAPACVPETKLDVAERIWQELLPRRELKIGDNRLLVQSRAGSREIYNAANLSDGERVVFYFIGSCLMAPENSVIIIDEPENHLHKAIQLQLWNALQRERPDCLFIYLTHDFDFAAGMREALKIWTKDYDGEQWDWQVVPQDTELPESLHLELLGSRQSVLFIEGDRGSRDYAAFGHLFPDFTLAPVGGCRNVIEAVRTFRSQQQYHGIEAYGLIDYDGRPSDEVSVLAKNGVHVLNVAIIENLFITEDVFRAVSTGLGENADHAWNEFLSGVFEEVKQNPNTIIASYVQAEIDERLAYAPKGKTEESLRAAHTDLLRSVDFDAIYNQASEEVERIVQKQDYNALLRFSRSKGLIVSKADKPLDLAKGSYINRVLRMLSVPGLREPIIDAMRKHVPDIGREKNIAVSETGDKQEG